MKNNENLIEGKTYEFAIRMVKAYQYLEKTNRGFALSSQLLRSGTSIGAMVHEAKFAQSRADFINKLSIALKEANETKYWIRLFHDTHYFDDTMFDSIYNDVKEIVAMLVAIVRTSKDNNV